MSSTYMEDSQDERSSDVPISCSGDVQITFQTLFGDRLERRQKKTVWNVAGTMHRHANHVHFWALRLNVARTSLEQVVGTSPEQWKIGTVPRAHRAHCVHYGPVGGGGIHYKES